MWNSLPNDVVEADTIYRPTFKNQLDKYWSNK